MPYSGVKPFLPYPERPTANQLLINANGCLCPRNQSPEPGSYRAAAGLVVEGIHVARRAALDLLALAGDAAEAVVVPPDVGVFGAPIGEDREGLPAQAVMLESLDDGGRRRGVLLLGQAPAASRYVTFTIRPPVDWPSPSCSRRDRLSGTGFASWVW